MKNKLYFLEFGSDGVWSDCELENPCAEITSVKWNTRYTAAWETYLKSK